MAIGIAVEEIRSSVVACRSAPSGQSVGCALQKVATRIPEVGSNVCVTIHGLTIIFFNIVLLHCGSYISISYVSASERSIIYVPLVDPAKPREYVGFLLGISFHVQAFVPA